jgi:pectinesterase
MNTGEGASVKERATWSKQLTKKEAAEYSVENMFKTTSNWDPYK